MTYKTLTVVHDLLVKNVKDAEHYYNSLKNRLTSCWDWEPLTQDAFEKLQHARAALEDFENTQF